MYLLICKDANTTQESRGSTNLSSQQHVRPSKLGHHCFILSLKWPDRPFLLSTDQNGPCFCPLTRLTVCSLTGMTTRSGQTDHLLCPMTWLTIPPVHRLNWPLFQFIGQTGAGRGMTTCWSYGAPEINYLMLVRAVPDILYLSCQTGNTSTHIHALGIMSKLTTFIKCHSRFS